MTIRGRTVLPSQFGQPSRELRAAVSASRAFHLEFRYATGNFFLRVQNKGVRPFLADFCRRGSVRGDCGQSSPCALTPLRGAFWTSAVSAAGNSLLSLPGEARKAESRPGWRGVRMGQARRSLYTNLRKVVRGKMQKPPEFPRGGVVEPTVLASCPPQTTASPVKSID